MQAVSVVIVCKNGANTIAEVVKSVVPLTDDILVADTGSDDSTVQTAKAAGARVMQVAWEGFGETKNNTMAAAKYNWILSLDADEIMDNELLQQLNAIKFTDQKQVFELKFKNYLGDKLIQYGAWGGVKKVRIFNREKVYWNDEYVHEELILPIDAKKILVQGFVLHKTAASLEEFRSKMKVYAELNARRYYKKGKKSYLITLILNPVFDFVKNYFFRLGFLDGYEGFAIARIHAWYTYLKYAGLRSLYQQNKHAP